MKQILVENDLLHKALQVCNMYVQNFHETQSKPQYSNYDKLRRTYITVLHDI